MSKKPFHIFAFLLLLVTSLSYPSAAFTDPGKGPQMEYAIKASFIYNFTRFIQWPQNSFFSANDEFVIGIVGDNPFGKNLDLLAAKKKIQGRKVIVKYFPTPDKIRKSHLLFITSIKKNKTKEIVNTFKTKKVLLISDTPGFAELGVAINFHIRKQKVRFEINRKALEKAGLKASSQLLNLGKIVGGK